MKNVIRFGVHTLLPFGLVIVIFFASLITSVDATNNTPDKIVTFQQSEELKSVNIDEDVVLDLNDFDDIRGPKGFIIYCEIDLFSNTMECCINYELLIKETDIINTFLAKN
jgi:hypothetical protein